MTHQIKISERESEVFPLSSWGCSQQSSPSSAHLSSPSLPAPQLLYTRAAACHRQHSLPSVLAVLTQFPSNSEDEEERKPSQLPSRWVLVHLTRDL